MKLFAALLLGALAACGFAPLGFWPLTLIGLAGLMGLVARAKRLRGALALGWWFGLGHFVIGLNWIATAFYYQDAMPHWLGWIAVLLLSLFLAVYPAAAAGLAWRWGRRAGGPYVLLFAAAWIVTEWLRATMFTGFAWNPIGVVTVPLLPVAGLARLIGTYGLSGIVILVTGAIFLLATPERKGVGLIVAPVLAIALLALLVVNQGAPSRQGPPIRIVQPNIGQQDKWNPAFDRTNFARLAQLTGKPTAEPRLILWPEAAVPDYLEEEPAARRRIGLLMGQRDMLMTGGVALEYDRKGEVIAARNSLFALDGAGRLLGRYDKAHLVPYGEYLPMRPILSAIGLSRLAPGDLDFWPGPGPATFALPGFGKAGVQICYEIIFSGHVVDPRNRPDFIFNPSNDAWFGKWGPPQHLAQARLRAIEEGLPVIRSTPTGISAVIDADGRLIAHLPWRKPGFIDARLPAPHAPTPFARYGNLLPFLFAALLVALAIAVRLRAR